MSWRALFFTIVAVLLVIFTFQNHTVVSLKFLIWQSDNVPLVFALFGTLIFGFLMAQILQLPRIYKLKRELKKALRDLENTKPKVAEPDKKARPKDASLGTEYQGGFFTDEE